MTKLKVKNVDKRKATNKTAKGKAKKMDPPNASTKENLGGVELNEPVLKNKAKVTTSTIGGKKRTFLVENSDKSSVFEKKIKLMETNNHMDDKTHRREKGKISASQSGLIKRVSFADNLENTRIFDKKMKIVASPSTANPGKSIVKGPIIVDDLEESAASNDGEIITSELIEEDSQPVRKNKFQVTRQQKEKLLTMTRKERKEFLRELKRKRKANFDVIVQCKSLWEKLRSGKTSESERKKCIAEIYDLVKAKLKEMIYAHDTCRVIECLLNFGDKELRTAIFEELTPEFVRMSKSLYARHFITKILKTGTSSQRQTIMSAFSGHCLRMFLNPLSAQVLEIAFNDYANGCQRFQILIEFYAKDFSNLKNPDGLPRTFKEILDAHPQRKESIIASLEKTLKIVMEKPQLAYSLSLYLLNNYMEICDNSQMLEVIDSLKLRIPEIIHIKDGSNIALDCIWKSAAKDRKVIVKSFKGLVAKAACEQYGYLVLIAIFDAVDDTVLVNKYICQELIKDIDGVIENDYGVKCLHYLVHPKDPRYFSKHLLSILKKGEKNPQSKKETKQRCIELFSSIQQPLLKYFATNMEKLLFNGKTTLLVLDTLEPPTKFDLFERVVDQDLRLECYNAIAKICTKKFVPNDAELHAIEHPQAHFVISKLLKSDSAMDVKLSDCLLNQCGQQIFSWVKCNRGCLILLYMLENGSPETVVTIKSSLKLSMLNAFDSKGARSLGKKLKA